jgi:hypothetical protein
MSHVTQRRPLFTEIHVPAALAWSWRGDTRGESAKKSCIGSGDVFAWGFGGFLTTGVGTIVMGTFTFHSNFDRRRRFRVGEPERACRYHLEVF